MNGSNHNVSHLTPSSTPAAVDTLYEDEFFFTADGTDAPWHKWQPQCELLAVLYLFNHLWLE